MPVSNRDRQGERQHGKVDGDPRLVGHVELGHQRDDGPDGAEREQHAEESAGERQQDALGQQLPQQAAAAGANRHPNRHLARPRGAARQLEIGDVGTRDEEQERDRAEEQLQAGPHLAARHRHVQVVPQPGREALLRKRRRLLLGQPLMQRPELLLGDGARHARAPAARWD